MPRCLAAALFAAFVLFAAAPPALAASFDCGRASTALETAVCQDRTLSALDEEMAQNYLGLLRRISGSNESLMKAEQKAWLKQRNACGADERCIAAQYRARIQRIAEVASSEGLIVLPKRTASTPATAAASPSRSIFQPTPATASTATAQSPATAAIVTPPATAPIRTTAQEAAAPTRAEGIELPQPKSSGIINKVLSKVAPNLVDREPDTNALSVDPEPRKVTVRRDDRGRNQSVLPGDDPFADEIVRREPERRKVTTTREPATVETPDSAPVALQAPKESKKQKSEPPDDPGAPAVLLYTTPDTSNVIRMPDGESPFDQLDAQNAFEPPPGRPLKVTPRSLPQPIKKAFDANRFDAFNEPPNG